VLLGSFARASTAPASTSQTATAKLPPRVIQVFAVASSICGAILWNSDLVALRAALPVTSLSPYRELDFDRRNAVACLIGLT